MSEEHEETHELIIEALHQAHDLLAILGERVKKLEEGTPDEDDCDCWVCRGNAEAAKAITYDRLFEGRKGEEP